MFPSRWYKLCPIVASVDRPKTSADGNEDAKGKNKACLPLDVAIETLLLQQAYFYRLLPSRLIDRLSACL